MKSINVRVLKERVDKKNIVILDVREKEELNIASIKGAIHIPMMEVQSRVGELKKKREYAVICHSGIRSAQVCWLLEKYNFIVYNVVGGINSWSEEIDSSIQKY